MKKGPGVKHLSDMITINSPNGSWSDQGWQNYITEENLSIAKAKNNGAAKPWEVADVSDTVYFDGKYAVKAIE
jgi:hypothetical protein